MCPHLRDLFYKSDVTHCPETRRFLGRRVVARCFQRSPLCSKRVDTEILLTPSRRRFRSRGPPCQLPSRLTRCRRGSCLGLHAIKFYRNGEERWYRKKEKKGVHAHAQPLCEFPLSGHEAFLTPTLHVALTIKPRNYARALASLRVNPGLETWNLECWNMARVRYVTARRGHIALAISLANGCKLLAISTTYSQTAFLRVYSHTVKLLLFRFSID